MCEGPEGRRREQHDDHGEPCGHDGVDARRGLNAAQIQSRKQAGEKDDPNHVGHRRKKVQGSLAAPHDTDERVEDVVERHAPAGHIPETGVQLFADIGVGRATLGIGARHATVAVGSEEHGNQGRENRQNHVASGFFVDHAKDRHGSGWLDEDDAIKDEVSIPKRSLEGQTAFLCCHRSLSHNH